MGKCVVCGKKIKGFGHNPSPLANIGRVCDDCNIKVIRERFRRLGK